MNAFVVLRLTFKTNKSASVITSPANFFLQILNQLTTILTCLPFSYKHKELSKEIRIMLSKVI